MSMLITVPSNHDGYGPGALGVSWGFFAPATTFVAARLYVRLGLRKNAGWDDVFSLYTCIFTQLTVNDGGGQHLYHVIQDLPKFQKLLFNMTMTEFGIVLGISLLKISVVAFVLRLIRKTPHLRYIRWICYADLALFVPITIALFFVVALQCIPLSALWNELMPADECMGRKIVAEVITAYFAVSAASDLLTGIIPVFVLMGLQMSRACRISISVLTGLGCCISVTSIYKAVVAIKVFTGPDVSYDIAYMSFECSIELNLGIIVASIPTLPPLFEAVGIMKEGRFSWVGPQTASSEGNRRSISMPYNFESMSSSKKLHAASNVDDSVADRTASDATLAAQEEGKAVGVHGDEMRSEGVIMRTVDVHVHEQSDLESFRNSLNRRQHPWLQVGQSSRDQQNLEAQNSSAPMV